MNKGFRFGRRKSDWLIPGALLLIVGAAVGWGLYNRTHRHDEEVMSKMTRAQVQIMHRIITHQQRQHGKLAQSQ